MSPEKRQKLEQKVLAQLPPDATEAEKVVFLETGLWHEYVELVVYRDPATDFPEDDDVIEYATGIRKKTVEAVMKQYAEKYPGAHIALYSTGQHEPIYYYN